MTIRVLHVLPSLDAGGAERLVVEMVSEARERGVDARIAVLTDAAPDSPVDADARERSLPVQVLGRHRFDPRALARLRRLASGADVVHAHLFPAFYAAALVCRGPLIVTEHSPTNHRRESRGARVAERWVYSRYTVKTAISEGVAHALAAYLVDIGVKGSVTVVENGVPLQRYAAGATPVDAPFEASRTLRLVSVGTLDGRKDVGAAVQAVAASSGVGLTVVGDGPQRAALETMARSLGADVTFLGLRHDVPALLRQHDALVMTSRYEGFGLVAVEAMASGLPVLAPALPGLASVVGPGGLLHPAQDGAALVHDIARLRDDPQLRERLARAARGQAQRFGVDRTVTAYLHLYAQTTGRP